METSQFEAVKVGLKQDNSGYILTLRIHQMRFQKL
jgi:hypothetical protein